jgi:membrane protease YdiL (CAAX protease family)
VGIFLAGLFLAFGYIRTQQLWLSIGLHIGWNFSEGVIFGFPVSGLDGFHLPSITTIGPDLWTGGSFGPEAGLIILPALILGTFLIYFYSHPNIRMRK